jgi:alcohol dehydrogenase
MMQNCFIYPGSIIELQFILHELRFKKIFIVTGKQSYIQCGAKDKIETLVKGYDVTYFAEFHANPNLDDVLKGIQLFKKSRAEAILAVGGGSAIDMAKLINYYHNAEFESVNVGNITNENFNPKPLICIPTTAGSGSEATHFAVMYINDQKFSIADEKMIPQFVIIDTEFHYSQSPYQKAVSGVDALSQSIESIWSLRSTNESLSYSKTALKLIWENLHSTVKNGDELSHLKVAIGANLAGRAINISKTTAPHALSYGFTSIYGIPHGHAVALFLPFFLHYHNNLSETNCVYENDFFKVKEKIAEISSIINCEADRVYFEVYRWLKKLNIEIDFQRLNISFAEFEKAIKGLSLERLSNNPGIIYEKDFRKIYVFNNSLTNGELH